jgi:methionine synthase / methylenetetrahydrofolate reductase(NADPH)
MPLDLLARLKQAPMLCDGAMGTLLYAKGIFINRCYDELNLAMPDLIRDIHHDYFQAGAEIAETNTFGANSFRLARHGLAEKTKAINLAGAKLAREAAKAFSGLVAGSVGPLGVRIEPLGKISLDEAHAAFLEQISALVEGGVDLLILETFGYVEELRQALRAARDVSPEVPVVAQVTIDEDGNCLDGSSPETFGAKLADWGADVIGCNCSVGPGAMLAAMERVHQVTNGIPLSAQPNAGMPRAVEGRNIYLCSPEYMANYVPQFVAAGVRLIGGCCGTTPEHIKFMKSFVRADAAKGAASPSLLKKKSEAPTVPTLPLEQRTGLGARIARGEFATMIEILPPRGTQATKEIEAARFLKSIGVDAINIPDSPRASARMSNQALATLLRQQVGIEPILHYTCRDRNVLGIQSDLLGAEALGIRNLICITGDPPKMGNYPDATAVFDVDAIGLVNIVASLNKGLDLGGNPIGAATGFVIGVGEYAVTQPVFDLRLLEQFLHKIEGCRIPVIAGIWPLISVRNAEFMQSELGVAVPDEIMKRMARASTAEAARAEGVAIAREMLLAVRNLVQGVQISAPMGRYAAAVDVLEALGTAQSSDSASA